MKHHYFPVEVQFEDIDLGGVVHHPNYLKYFERARGAWFKEIGLPYGEFIKKQTAFIITDVQIKYIQSAQYEEKYWVLSRLKDLTKVRLVLEQSLIIKKPAQLSELDKKHIFTRSEITLCSFDLVSKKPLRLPETVYSYFQ